jgi:hypothetical protein
MMFPAFLRRLSWGLASKPWPWIAARTGCAALLAGITIAVILLQPSRTSTMGEPAQPEQQQGAAAAPREEDYENPALTPVDERRVAVRLELASEVDAAGDARTQLVVKLAPAMHAFVKRMLTHQVAGQRLFKIPLLMKNVLDFMDLDATGSIPENIEGEFAEDVIRVRMREVGFARHQDGHWVYPLTTDPSVRYELVRKQKGRIITVRSLRQIGSSQVLTKVTLTLPEGAHDIQLVGKPSQLVYQLPVPAAKGGVAEAEPLFNLEAKPHILSALYRLYGDRRFPRFWAARSALHNRSEQTLTDYRIRYRLPGYADWGAWQHSDRVLPGQTAVDFFQPALKPEVMRELRVASPALIEAEYEYVQPGGAKVRKKASALTRLLGFNDGVYTDTRLDYASPWCEMLRGMPHLLASFTAGNDPVMHAAAELARRTAGGASPRDGDKEATRFLKAAYDLMRRNVAYEPARGTDIDGVPSQYLKYGRDVLRTKQGTCINTSILYASMAEAAGLDPAIVVIPGHAFAAVRLPRSRKLLFVETTGGTVTANVPFDLACKVAREEFAKAAKSGLLMIVSISELRAMGVAPPQLAEVGADVLDQWKIAPPDEAARRTDGRGADARPGPGGARRATIVAVRKESDVVRDGMRGMAFHVHLKIKQARGVPCVLLVVCANERNELVRTDLPGYSLKGRLANVVAVTPDRDEAEWADLVLFLPYRGIEMGPGTQDFNAILAVIADGRQLNEPPTLIPFRLAKAGKRHRFRGFGSSRTR